MFSAARLQRRARFFLLYDTNSIRALARLARASCYARCYNDNKTKQESKHWIKLLRAKVLRTTEKFGPYY
jgi:hypothetical protein